ncbi:hypothetical protein L228DRAFT_264165 [Xylona heveae TC161]|uniref:DNA replication checkpoint mediator MRC1 domain-containing protein n=1 Tax=Xylona heveae (strain CBS 132557 / TC161) TaxID=1328760 RepID=A0A164ZFV6_XYLHT|nr:hypothetical protein L228DRAFT_264165 [Xylona heveae TC161]KZF19051.1 hypothetical protein L228DRAFT_264165 [Xylona heveae TC161]
MERSRSSSPWGSPEVPENQQSPRIAPGELTPRSKIKALLANFDDDEQGSDDDGSSRARERLRAAIATRNEENTRASNKLDKQSTSATKHTTTGSDEEDSDDDVALRPRGRLAARMMASKADKEQEKSDGHQNDEANSPGKKRLGGRLVLRKAVDSPKTSPRTAEQSSHQGQEAEIGDQDVSSPASQEPRTKPVRSLFGPFEEEQAPPSETVEVVGENPTLRVDNDASGSDSDLPDEPQNNARLLALVARKREERAAKEAEAARAREEREARLKEAQQLDSGSESGSDKETGRRLTQQARPTRKASKKALEDMHRETQRMSRNMQLAHEARTKKKITKESLFARFNFRGNPASSTTPTEEAQNKGSISDNAATTSGSSSAPTSDVEHAAGKDTPPTSPILPENSSAEKDNTEGKSLETVDSAPSIANDIAGTNDENEDRDGPTLEDLLSQPIRKIDKGKGKATEAVAQSGAQKRTEITGTKSKRNSSNVQSFNFRLPDFSRVAIGNDSDSDLEIVPAKSKNLSVFDRVKPQEKQDTRSYIKLRALAHLTSPGRKRRNEGPSMNPAQLQATLQQRARQQAAKQREERIQELRQRGIIIQTAEERDQAQMEVEDLVEKARREAEEIMKREKEAAKEEKRRAGIDVSEDDEEDGDWEGESDEGEAGDTDGDDEEEDVEQFGSENEGEDDEGNEMELQQKADGAGLIDGEAAEEEEPSMDEDESAEFSVAPQQPPQRKSRNLRVISDDEDEDDDANGQVQEESSSMQQKGLPPTNVSAIPGLAGMKDAPMSLTQMFQGTMAASETQDPSMSKQENLDEIDMEQDSLAFLRQMPGNEPSELRSFIEGGSQDIVRDSQGYSQQDEITLHYSQSHTYANGSNDLSQTIPATQLSEIPDPTQDVGLRMNSLVQNRHGFEEDPPSTVATVIVSPKNEMKRRGRLRRRGVDREALLSDVEEEATATETAATEQGDFEISANAFDILRNGARKPQSTPFDREKSKAKAMVEEQAEESEDEYAGLGGASDDENASEDDEEVRQMIDEGDVEVKERELAALHADKERANDEKQVKKLFRDITTGMLRRKRGADLDLSDSDDDGEAQRRRKRREFAKMRKALLADENVGKIAENPRKLAFLRAIEDRDEEEGTGFLDQTEDDWLMPHISQSQSQSQDPLDTQVQPAESVTVATSNNDNSIGKRKRSIDETEGNEENRPPPHMRQHATKALSKSKRPSTLAEIRQSVAFLTEAPNAPAHAPDSESDEERPESDEIDRVEDSQLSMMATAVDAGADAENNIQTTTWTTTTSKPNARDPFASRRTTRSHAIIDRISLRRAASSNASSAGGKMAFHDPSATGSSSATGFPFRVPSLVRRATSNLSAASLNSSGQNASPTGVVVARERQAGGDSTDSIVKRGGTKKSSINYHQNARAKERESERTRAIRKSDKKREAGRIRLASERGGLLGMIGGGGSFD